MLLVNNLAFDNSCVVQIFKTPSFNFSPAILMLDDSYINWSLHSIVFYLKIACHQLTPLTWLEASVCSTPESRRLGRRRASECRGHAVQSVLWCPNLSVRHSYESLYWIFTCICIESKTTAVSANYSQDVVHNWVRKMNE